MISSVISQSDWSLRHFGNRPKKLDFVHQTASHQGCHGLAMRLHHKTRVVQPKKDLGSIGNMPRNNFQWVYLEMFGTYPAVHNRVYSLHDMEEGIPTTGCVPNIGIPRKGWYIHILYT